MNALINTSIGDIFSFVEINGITYYAEFSGENQWQRKDYQLLCHVEECNNDFDNNRHVDGRYKIAWKISVENDIEEIKLTCRLNTSLNVDIDNDDDECKAARYIKYKRTHLCIADEGSDGLLRRACHNEMMPERLIPWFKLKQEYSGCVVNSIMVTDDELGEEVYLPNLKKGEVAEIKYAIAWKNDISTDWNADVSLGSEAYEFLARSTSTSP